ncbi:GNAT family N-acetyltransferase [uncultured Imperialibacter sp.]|uniref:GNAT family N-acetyltransferase n=1 Tax=uncultured Imperialibacter sp. TaxID=1672639 RepID=UPI0030DAF3E7|tara:strand:- start:15799 stop:16305 length:507 start_codon:yes stop_codon:yes gene_type:complete
MKIVNTQLSDLNLIYHLFDESIRYQEAKGYPVWRNYDKGAIIRDIEQGNQYKVVAGADLLIVFSVAYSDKLIWRAMDQGDAVYLHRIVVNPVFKGQRLFGHIGDWAKSHARHKGLSAVRMDTWANNPTIVNYYQGFGFTFVENYITPDSEELPVHNRKLGLSLLEHRL